jgi:hypothetical protein
LRFYLVRAQQDATQDEEQADTRPARRLAGLVDKYEDQIDEKSDRTPRHGELSRWLSIQGSARNHCLSVPLISSLPNHTGLRVIRGGFFVYGG